MPKMQDTELSAIVDSLIFDSVSYNSEFMKENEELLKRYNQEAYGDEEAGFSSVVASDVRDIVESDMTSMVRVFLGSGDVIEFQANTDDASEVKEAEEKTSLINHLVLRRPNSYRIIHGFLKDAEIQKMGVVHYYVETLRKTRETLKKDLTTAQATMLKEKMLNAKDVEKVDIVEKEKLEEEGKFNIRFRETISFKDLVIENIPTQNFLISKHSATKDSARMVGHESYPTRGDLVAGGMTEEEVNKFPTSNGSSSSSGQENGGTKQSNNLDAIRWRDEGGDITDSKSFREWTSQKVYQALIFAYIDVDGDGIAERRRIVKIGNSITENEPYDHAPYAVTSCILEPHKAIGNSRASLVVQDQSVNTELERAILDNIYDVGNPRPLIGDGVDHDDYFDSKRAGVVRMKPGATQTPGDSIAIIPTQFIGNEVLLVKQSRAQSQSSRTGTLLDSQGLEADQVSQETATRFNGIEKASEAKIELVARNHGEVGMRELYDGVAWTLRRFLDKDISVRLANGKAITVNPSLWQHESVARSTVGLGATKGEQATQKWLGMLQIQQNLQASGSLLVDDQKVYNTLDRMAQALGHATVSDFFNNPDIPEDLLLAQYQQLTLAMQQAQQQIEQLSQSNPLAEAEKVRAEASLIKAKSVEQVEMIKADMQTTIAELKLLQQKGFHDSDKVFDYTELELKYGIDIKGVGQNG